LTVFHPNTFEEAARDYVARLAQVGILPFLLERIGAWWERGEEIDVMAVSDTEGAMFVGECKWSVHPIDLDVFVDLKRKARIAGASGRWPTVFFILFAKTGFTPELQSVAASEGVRLVQAAELLEEPS
jgi:AAA+ ATPase superfamily predicted ATPase